jgi:microcystin degradation protein MlrC
MIRVAIGGLHTECSSYSPLEQVREDFTRAEGDALVARANFDFAACGITPVPLFHERSVPGGPVARDCFEAQRGEFFEMLRAALPLDGILLLMHGAMFVPGVDDPEGEFIAEVRRIVGPDCIVSAAFDLHGQITRQIVDNLDAFAAYRTAPHIDVPETCARAARMLADALIGSPRPSVVWEPVPVLVSGEMSSTFVEPCQSLYAMLPKEDAKEGVLDANLMIGYVWADSPRATASAVVTCIDLEAGAASAGRIAKAYRDARQDLVFDMNSLPLAEGIAAISGPIVLADSGDNPTAGGVGDRADVLAAIKADGRPALFAGIADPKAYAQIEAGASEILLGGTLGGGGPRVTLKVDAARLAMECAVVTSGNLTVVVSRKRRPFHDFADFDKLGLNLDDHPLLVVKSGYLSPDIRTLPRDQIMLLTDGAVCQDVIRQPNEHRPRPIFPFQEI